MTEFGALRPKTYSYLMDDCNSDKKAKGTKKCVIKKYLNSMIINEVILKSQQKIKSEAHNVYTEEVNKIALSSNDDKRLETFDKLHHILIEQVLGKYAKQRC